MSEIKKKLHQLHHEKELVKKNLQLLFKIYDVDNRGILDRDQLYLIQSDLRKQQSLGGQPIDIFEKCYAIIDKDGDGCISPDELSIKCLEKIFIILCRPDDEVLSFFKKKFQEFDIDDSGSLERDECKQIFDSMCDRMKLQRCENWRIDYIISLIDDDKNWKIDFDEFMTNYNVIYNELEKNLPVGVTEASYRQIMEVRDSKKIEDHELETLCIIAKKFFKSKKKVEIIKSNQSKTDKDMPVYDLNAFNHNDSRKIVPMNLLINDTSHFKDQIQAIKDSANDKDYDKRQANSDEDQKKIDNMLVTKIAKAYWEAVGGSESKERQKEFFEKKSYKHLEEITKLGCKDLVMLVRLLGGVRNFVVSRMSDWRPAEKIVGDEEVTDGDEIDYTALMNMKFTLNDSFRRVGINVENEHNKNLQNNYFERQQTFAKNHKRPNSLYMMASKNLTNQPNHSSTVNLDTFKKTPSNQDLMTLSRCYSAKKISRQSLPIHKGTMGDLNIEAIQESFNPLKANDTIVSSDNRQSVGNITEKGPNGTNPSDLNVFSYHSKTSKNQVPLFKTIRANTPVNSKKTEHQCPQKRQNSVTTWKIMNRSVMPGSTKSKFNQENSKTAFFSIKKSGVGKNELEKSGSYIEDKLSSIDNKDRRNQRHPSINNLGQVRYSENFNYKGYNSTKNI